MPLVFARSLILSLLPALSTAPVLAQTAPHGPVPGQNGFVRAPAVGKESNAPETEIIIISPSLKGMRVLRGDWEPPDVLLLTYTEDWTEALAAILNSATQESHVVLLTEPDNSAVLPGHSAGRLPAKAEATSVTIVPLEHDTPWVRDYGPLQITDADGRNTWLDFYYGPHRRSDDRMPVQLSRHWPMDVEQYSLPLDGGAVISNGRGLCVMTDRNLMSLGLDASSYDGWVWHGGSDHTSTDTFLFTLGCGALVVVPALKGEATGHVDMSAQFLAPDIVAVATVSGHGNAAIAVALDEGAARIERGAERIGQRMRVFRVPMHVDASTFYTHINGTRLRSSFLVPSYTGVPAVVQAQAFRTLQRAMPGVRLVPIAADAMIAGGGAIHCMTLGLSLGESAAPAIRVPFSLAGRGSKGPHQGRPRL